MFDDPVAVMLRHLAVSVPDVAASGRVPNPRPQSFVRLVMVGSDRFTPQHRDARVAIECWAATDAQADRLAARVEEAVAEYADSFNHVPLGPDGWAAGPRLLPDPDSGSPRMVMTLILRQRNR